MERVDMCERRHEYLYEIVSYPLLAKKMNYITNFLFHIPNKEYRCPHTWKHDALYSYKLLSLQF